MIEGPWSAGVKLLVFGNFSAFLGIIYQAFFARTGGSHLVVLTVNLVVSNKGTFPV